LVQEQGRTGRAMRMVGRARFERGEYGLVRSSLFLFPSRRLLQMPKLTRSISGILRRTG
jgi:hypothetical protein